MTFAAAATLLSVYFSETLRSDEGPNASGLQRVGFSV